MLRRGSTRPTVAPKRIPQNQRHCTPALLTLALAAALVGQRAAAAHGRGENAVTHWNVIATSAFAPSQGTNPMAQSRTLAIFHAAIHDALNAIEPRFQAYTPGLERARGASAEAAIAAAARDVLVALLPEQAALVEAEYERVLAAIPDGAAKVAGVAAGQASARATITRRRHDGAEKATQPPYVPRAGLGEYQFTPPFDFAAQPGWGQVTPFVIALREHTTRGSPQRPKRTANRGSTPASTFRMQYETADNKAAALVEQSPRRCDRCGGRSPIDHCPPNPRLLGWSQRARFTGF